MKSIARPSRFPSPLKAALSSSNYPRLYSILNQNIARPHYDRPLSSRHELEDKVPWLANQPLHQLSLADLVKHGRPPLSAEALLSSARFTLSLLPIRLAHRIQALRNLPYIVVSNPNISRIYNNYQHSLSTLLPWQGKTISSLDDEIKFTQVLAELVQTHTDTIPILAKGFIECRKYISPSEVTRFLDEHLRARIGTRLVAEQHIALHYSSTPHFDPEASPTLCPEPKTHPSYIGVIDTTLRPASVIDSCGDFVADICELNYGVRPEWVVDGEPDATFAFVPMHLEYIVTELLKNAFRATVENGMSREPVVVTIAPEPASSSASAATPGVYSDYCPPNSSQKNSSSSSSSGSNSISSSQQGKAAAQQQQQQQQKQAQHGIIPLHDRAPGVTIRIRDRGGGINPAVLPNIWRYSFTTFNDADDDDHHESPGAWGEEAMGLISNTGVGGSTIAGLGYGLPLSRAYAEYFGGGIAVQSLYGWGTDVYLRLKGVGKIEY
ncbi:alpha-ketoacid dehydrogenase kinase [Neurospora crassa]|uniref:Protein-serine/threonine kinase n=1 Tax=Neurospora crassa (strain ATCC 24698 / 74-OR23-1A / CBS 708.71 / DSM 1257 / FGSC 987) TaxID=367110 RepID=V5IP70_NEUCR|nr:mitochondrial pyruvate dehydrogenase kinase [Neurospora crassa OR74A]ESA42969.1 mitochondrial pyruvate dehydrogenase kinase [Neurospora crassa OR74A]KHE82307.1 alpha-ketoacid dehydrogenase kinase [Neurospora crassa]|eukprot:XP_011394408.1 mitochondrial pyruvate dehydrogenase kinase [Neurospora crassa OR74A]